MDMIQDSIQPKVLGENNPTLGKRKVMVFCLICLNGFERNLQLAV